jgi:hypothetical protein
LPNSLPGKQKSRGRSTNTAARYDIVAARSLENGATFSRDTRIAPATVNAGTATFIGEYAGIAATASIRLSRWRLDGGEEMAIDADPGKGRESGGPRTRFDPETGLRGRRLAAPGRYGAMRTWVEAWPRLPAMSAARTVIA